jgi:arylsulfatase A-like enzyme/Flp pilus assembly protein TadD
MWLLPASFTLLASLNGCGGGLGAPATASAEGPPSILLISLDTTRADHLGAYAAGVTTTPALDGLAARGVVFERAYTPVPVTLPAHASLMTGLAPAGHGVHDNGLHRLPDDIPTTAEILAADGYATSAVIGSAVLDRQYGLDRGFQSYDDRVGALGGMAIPERTAAQVTEAALQAADGLAGPFFLFVHYFDPHATYAPPADFAKSFRGRLYDGEIAYVDQQIGRLLSGLQQRRLLDNTIVVVVADHGESLGEHGEPTHGVFLYDSTVRVPMIFAGPGLPTGRRVEAPASLMDVLPTLSALTGTSVPPDLDGRSLLPLMDSAPEPAAAQVWLPLESRFGLNSYGWAPLVGMTDGRIKWIGAPTAEFYDLARDPGERHNLAADNATEIDRLRRLFASRWSSRREAPPPGIAIDAEQAARLEQLESLGYVSAPGRTIRDSTPRPDPKDVIGALAEINAARAEIGAGRAHQAGRILVSVLERSPENVSALILLGSSRIVTGDFAGAVLPLRRAAELAPHKGDVHYNLGIALMSTGDAGGAEAAWSRALEVSPRYLEAAVNLIDLLQRGGRVGEARERLDHARMNGLDDPVLDYLDGRLALEVGDRERARSILARSLSGTLPPAIAADARNLLASVDH